MVGVWIVVDEGNSAEYRKGANQLLYVSPMRRIPLAELPLGGRQEPGYGGGRPEFFHPLFLAPLPYSFSSSRTA